MRRVLFGLVVLAATLAATPAAAGNKWQAPAHAQVAPANYITGCSGHILQAWHTTAAGNIYRMKGHLCLEVGPQSGNSLAINTRWHGHCTRNDVAWDGCRVNTELVVEVLTQAGWQDRGATAFSITEPSSGYFANSQTRVSFADYFADETHVRAKAEDPDNMRFLLADGTTVLKDMSDAAGPEVEICTVDPC
jgi:hypothetical protein